MTLLHYIQSEVQIVECVIRLGEFIRQLHDRLFDLVNSLCFANTSVVLNRLDRRHAAPTS